MASQFCSACGAALPPGAAFCAGCGQPVGAPPTGPSSVVPTPPFAPPPPNDPGAGPLPPTASVAPMSPPGPPLGVVLGLEGQRKFLLQHELLGGRRNYRVLDHEKHHLFTVRENSAEEMEARQATPVTGPTPGFHWGRSEPPTKLFVWSVADPSGTEQGRILVQEHGSSIVANLLDGSGRPVLAVRVDRGGMGGLDAKAVYPDGRTMFEARGNLLRHTFAIHDEAGAEVAKIHEAFVSVRDTFHLDVLRAIDPLCPLVFAVLIDGEKIESEQRHQAHHPGPGASFELR